MELTVLLFGPPASAARADRVVLEVAQPVTCGSIMVQLARACPPLAPMVEQGRLAVNGRFAEPGDPVVRSDEIALIAMVSGG